MSEPNNLETKGIQYDRVIGIIQNADPETVKMVEDMVVNHIEGNCLILLTIPMSGMFFAVHPTIGLHLQLLQTTLRTRKLPDSLNKLILPANAQLAF